MAVERQRLSLCRCRLVAADKCNSVLALINRHYRAILTSCRRHLALYYYLALHKACKTSPRNNRQLAGEGYGATPPPQQQQVLITAAVLSYQAQVIYGEI